MLCNANFKGFATGGIYSGPLKKICVPGLNCYSCPGALGACPLGSLQSTLADPERKISFYVTGFLIAFGAVFGRFICGWLCPFGLLQELVKAPMDFAVKRFPKLGEVFGKFRIPRIFRKLKYLLLIIFVIVLPLALTDKFGFGAPYFCEFICPAGVIMGAAPLYAATPAAFAFAGWLLDLKIWICVTVIIMCLFSRRFFCKYICPLGAIYGLFNPVSFIRLDFKKEACVNCGACETSCPMDIDPRVESKGAECIRCGKCVGSCGFGALKFPLATPTKRP